MSKRHARMAGKLHSWTTLVVRQLCSCSPRMECEYWMHTSVSTPLLLFFFFFFPSFLSRNVT